MVDRVCELVEERGIADPHLRFPTCFDVARDVTCASSSVSARPRLHVLVHLEKTRSTTTWRNSMVCLRWTACSFFKKICRADIFLDHLSVPSSLFAFIRAVFSAQACEEML